MPEFIIRTVNSLFENVADHASFPKAEDAMREGVRGAISIAADEAQHGAKATAVEVIVEDEDGQLKLRSIVSVGVAPLIVS